MKLVKFLLLSIVLVVVTSCSNKDLLNEDLGIETPIEYATISYSVGEVSNTAPIPLSDKLDKIIFIIQNDAVDNNSVNFSQRVEQNKGDASFGHISVTIPAGPYKIKCIGYKEFSGGRNVWGEGAFVDHLSNKITSSSILSSFIDKVYEGSVDGNTNGDKSVNLTLKRLNSGIDFKITNSSHINSNMIINVQPVNEIYNAQLNNFVNGARVISKSFDSLQDFKPGEDGLLMIFPSVVNITFTIGGKTYSPSKTQGITMLRNNKYIINGDITGIINDDLELQFNVEVDDNWEEEHNIELN